MSPNAGTLPFSVSRAHSSSTGVVDSKSVDAVVDDDDDSAALIATDDDDDRWTAAPAGGRCWEGGAKPRAMGMADDAIDATRRAAAADEWETMSSSGGGGIEGWLSGGGASPIRPSFVFCGECGVVCVLLCVLHEFGRGVT